MSRRQSIRQGYHQVQDETAQVVRRFNAVRQVSAQATGLAYIGVRTESGDTDYSYHETNPLGRQIPGTGTAIFAGQSRASGRELAPLPRYTA